MAISLPSLVGRRVWGGSLAVSVILAGLLIAPASAQAASSTSVPDAISQILTDTNALRAAGGLAPLVENSAMDAVAQNWAAQMYAAGSLTHNPNYSSQIPSGWSSAGENIASGFSVAAVVPAWHGSPGHYANIMGSYTDIGIGYIEANGQTWFVQDFGGYAAHAASVTAAVPAPAPVVVPSAPAPAPAAAPAAAPAPAASAPTRCVRWSHHKCTRYQVIKKASVKHSAVKHRAVKRRR